MHEKIIICPNSEKLKILVDLSKNKDIYNIKFMSKEEYISNYFFSYDERSIFYLMKKYNLHIDVAKAYLNSLYGVELEKVYDSKKLDFLKNIKKELIDNDLLIINNNFKDYISNREIEVINYYDLDKYEEESFNYKFDSTGSINNSVYEFKTMEDEVNFVCIKIYELIKKGININNIHLCNVSSDYYYTIKRLFSYYNIPINIPFKNSIYSTSIVKDYLDKGILNLEDNNEVVKKLVNVINSLVDLDNTDEIYKDILIDKLKNTYISNNILSNAVNISNLYDVSFDDDNYVFVLGFNQDILPKTYKDIDYISDSDKSSVSMYTSNYLNNREKKILTYILSKIKNLYLSYKLTSPFSEFYPSSLINELNLEVIKEFTDNYSYSNKYNIIRLGEMLDNYKLYGEKDSYLDELNTHYNIDYSSYSNKFNGINRDLFLEKLDYPFKLSYTALNSYNECSFKYYLNYVLKLNDYEDSFASFIGSLYHEILSLYRNNNFDFEVEYNKYLEKRELNLKEKILLIKIKHDLLELIDVLKSQNLLTGYDEEMHEKYVEVDIRDDISVKFIGYIDKIMYMKKIEDTYFSIVDYKTGKIDTNIESMKYGLHMQLPVYLYLLNYGRVFSNPIFTGIYYQNILFPYPKWEKNLDKVLKDRYLLKGYSTDNLEILERFDSTYMDSSLIKSMKYTDKFDRYSKVIDDDTLYNLVKFTKNMIEKKVDDILSCKFDINPKVYIKEDFSCKYCKFRDICFKMDSDVTYLEKVEDLSFLGGDK